MLTEIITNLISLPFAPDRDRHRLHTWQERWFTLMGSELCWFEKASESFPRGAIALNNHVRAQDGKNPIGGEKYVFEIIDESRHDSKKKREFACETMLDRQKWVDAIQTSIQSNRTRSISRSKTFGSVSDSNGVEGEDEDDSGRADSPSGSGLIDAGTRFIKSFNRTESLDDGMHFPDSKAGYMEKHNSYLIWNKRFFECANGELRYWKSEEAMKAGKPENSKIYLGDILKGSPTVNPGDQAGILLATDTRIYSFRCASKDECNEWIYNIHEWQHFLELK